MRIKKIVMALLLVLAVLFVPNVYAAEDIVIESVTKGNSGGNASYGNNPPTIDGLSITFDKITFKDKDDFVSFNVVISNESNEDYEINDEDLFSENEYFKYEFIFEGDSNIVPKNSKKNMVIIISYDKEVDPTIFDDNGQFTKTEEMSFTLSTQKVGETNNPKTGSGLIVALILVFLAVVAATSMILSNKTKLNKHFIMIIALSLAVVPVTIYAAKMVTIKLNTEIIVDKNYHFYFIDEENTCVSRTGSFEVSKVVTFGSSPVVTILDSDCVNGLFREKYGYTDPSITWSDILQPLNLDEEWLTSIFPEGSTIAVTPTDKIIHNMTYSWVAD